MDNRNKWWVISIPNLLLWIDVIILIINSGTALQLVSSNTQYLMLLPLMFHCGSIIRTRKNQKLIPLVACVLVIVCTAIMHLDSTINYYILLLINIISVFGIVITYGIKNILNVFIKIIGFLVPISLICYYLVNNTSFGSNFATYTNSNGVTYSFSYLYVFRRDLVFRNHGIFWEPGLYATVLVVSMIYLVIRAKRNTDITRRDIFTTACQILVFSWALFTTNSSAGIILFMLFLLFFFMIRGKRNRNSNGLAKSIVSTLMVVVVVIGILNYNSILQYFGLADNYFFSRITSAEGFTNNARYIYIMKCFELIGKNPILGYGVVETNNLIAQGVGDTCTSLYTILVFGICGIGYTILFIYSIMKQRYGLSATIVLCTMAVFILNKEPHLQIMLTWTILFGLLWGNGNNVQNDMLYE